MTLVELLKNNYAELIGPNPTQRTGSNVAGGSLDSILQRLLADPKALEGLNDQQYATLQNLLGLRGEQETREYNKALLQEQRAYDDPQAQLSRLMATGMSREAALQAIAGGASGGSAQAAAGQAPQMQMGLSPSESELNKVQAATSIANTVFGGVSALAGIGINASTAHFTNSLNGANAIAQKTANDAQVKSATLNSMFYKAQKLGLFDAGKMTFDSALQALENVSPQQSQEIADFVKSGAIDDLLSSPLGYRIGSSNYNTRFGNENAFTEMRNLLAAERAANLNTDLIQQQVWLAEANIEKVWQEVDQLASDNQFNEDSYALRLGLLETQTEVNAAQAEQSRAATKQIDTERQIAAINLHRMNLTKDDLDATALAQVARELKIAQTLGTDSAITTACDTILNNEKLRNACVTFDLLAKTNLNKLVGENQELLKYYNLTNEMNLGSIFDKYLKNSVAAGKVSHEVKSAVRAITGELVKTPFGSPIGL